MKELEKSKHPPQTAELKHPTAVNNSRNSFFYSIIYIKVKLSARWH